MRLSTPALLLLAAMNLSAEAKCPRVATNVAYRAEATASSFLSKPRINNGFRFAGSLAFDGSMGQDNRWICEDQKPWIVANMRKEYNICAFNIAKHDIYHTGFRGCSHTISLWVGGKDAVTPDALATRPSESDNWKVVVSSDDMENVMVEHDDLDDDVTAQYVRFDFDRTTCTGLTAKEKDFHRVFELQVLGTNIATTTSTSTTTTYTADPNIEALQQKLADLQKLLEGDGNSADDLVAEIQLIKDALTATDAGMVKERKRVDAKFAELSDGLKTANDNNAKLTFMLKTLQAPPKRPPLTENPGATCKGSSGAACSPSVQSSGDLDGGSGGNLELVAPSGGVVVKSSYCSTVDLCDLSRDVEALMLKFDPV